MIGMKTEDARNALQELRAGNQRLVSGKLERASRIEHRSFAELATGQSPKAAVLACSDSRVPPELAFDQGPGEIFVVRVAGNVAGPDQIGSIEFATEQLGVSLIVVLGHSDCGAVKATLADIRSPIPNLSPNLRGIIDRIRPAVEGISDDAGTDPLDKAVRMNVIATANALRSDSELLRRRSSNETIDIVGADYTIGTGVVEFFDAP